MKLLKTILSKENICELLKEYKGVILYLVFGFLTTVINVIVYGTCYKLMHIANVPSTIIAWGIAVVFAFITNKLFVFESKSFSVKVFVKELVSFFLCRTLTGLLDVAIMYVTVDKLALPEILWKFISNIIVIVLNYIASKFIVFTKKQSD